MQFMTCTTCQRVVQVNNCGICLGCQRGFPNMDAEDVWKPPVKKAEESEIQKLKAREKELEDAINQGLQQEEHKQEHQGRDEERKAPEASGGNSSKRRQRRKKEG